jgi:hypothetical protein
MMHAIFYKIEAKIVAKQKEVEKWTGTICPKIKKKIDKFTEWSKKCFVDLAAKRLYHVSSLEFEKIICCGHANKDMHLQQMATVRDTMPPCNCMLQRRQI